MTTTTTTMTTTRECTSTAPSLFPPSKSNACTCSRQACRNTMVHRRHCHSYFSHGDPWRWKMMLTLLGMMSLWLSSLGAVAVEINSEDDTFGLDDYFQDYLYAGYNPGVTDPIQDYEQSSTSEENANTAPADHSEDSHGNEEEDSPIFAKPDFLYSNQTGHRIVEFYAPWCPHCQHFKTHYVTFARTLTKLAEKAHTTIDFYAISCTAHTQLCRDQHINSYPKIKILKAGTSSVEEHSIPIPKSQQNNSTTTSNKENMNTNTTIANNETSVKDSIEEQEEEDEDEYEPSNVVNAWDLHPFGALQLLGITTTDEMMNEIHNNEKDHVVVSTNSNHDQTNNHNNNHKQQQQSNKPKSKQDVYNDAFLSFDFLLRNSIFLKNGPLDEASNSSFCEFINLLHFTLPPMWNIHTMINDIQQNLDKVTHSEHALLEVIEPHRPKVTKWSPSCRKGGSQGHTCGLWELFHIMSVGLVEWNRFVEDPWGLLTTMQSGDTLRNYIAHHFECLVCQTNFVNAYDSCAHDRCQRFFDSHTQDTSTFQDWMEFPLWLWETHNAVNVRLMHEQHDQQHPHEQNKDNDERNVEWPLRQDCPQCWNTDDTWNSDIIFKFLRLHYWPEDDIATEYRQQLSNVLQPQQDPQKYKNQNDQPPYELGDTTSETTSSSSFSFLLTCTLIITLTSVVAMLIYYIQNNVAKVKSGRHKKSDIVV